LAAVLAKLGGFVPPAGQWEEIAGMAHENLIEWRSFSPTA